MVTVNVANSNIAAGNRIHITDTFGLNENQKAKTIHPFSVPAYPQRHEKTINVNM